MIRTIAASVALVALMLFPNPAAAAEQSLAGSVALEAADESGIGIRLLDIPADAQDDPRVRSYIVDHVTPGTSIARRVQIQNNTTDSQTVMIYAGAASIVGDTFLGGDGPAINELTTWISPSIDTLEMDPGEQVDVLVRIDVPADAAEGEQYAALWAEVRSAADKATNIVSASRVGIRVYLSVGPGNGPAPDLEISKVDGGRSDDGSPRVSATITNTGGRALDVSATLALADGPGSLFAGPFPFRGVLTIAPGDSAEITVVLDKDLPAGPWQGTVEARSGLVVKSASGAVGFGGEGAGRIEPEMNWMLIGVSALILVLALVASCFWIIRISRRSAATPGHVSA